MDRFSAVVNRAEAHPHDFTLSRSAGPSWSALTLVGPSRFLAVPVVKSLRLIEETASAIKKVAQGGLNQVKTIMASLTAIWDAADRNAGVRAAAIDTFEIARALAEVEAPPERVRLRRLSDSTVYF